MGFDDFARAVMDRVTEIERRTAMQGVRGKVTDVDASKHLVRLEIGKNRKGESVKTAWLPYAQVAGALKIHSPPSVGQQMTLLAQAGDIQQAVALPLSWSQANPSPSTDGNAHVATFDGMRIEVRGQDMKVVVPKLVIEAGGGTITAEGGTLTFAGFIRVEHAGKNIGSDHTHGGIERGGANTDEPNG
jgi:phage baseplate assembly protein gpV